jgi:ACS family tartrate transporter-like MFS transporter
MGDPTSQISIPFGTVSGTAGDTTGKTAMRKVYWRIGLVLFFVYVFNYLDRTNIGIAKLKMQPDLGLSEAAFGLGAGLFFIGYVLFEVPSNLILYKVGARLWITRIAVTWGLAAMATAFAEGEWSFYGLRFLLGVAEAGLVPGVILYIAQWIPVASRARMIGMFYLAVPISTLFGAPISTWLMGFEPFGLTGWRFMLIVSGLPSVLIGYAIFKYMTDTPAEANWLTAPEREWLMHTLERERQADEHSAHKLSSTFAAVNDIRVLGFAAIFFSMIIPIYALSFFLPTIIKEMGQGFSTMQIGFITAVPYFFASLGMVLISRSSDRRNERAYHYALFALLGAAGFALAAFNLQGAPVLALIGFSVGAVGCISTLPAFWSAIPELLTGSGAAGGIALICALGNIAGFVSPYMVALVRGEAGDPVRTSAAIIVVALFLVLAAAIMVLVGRSIRRRASGNLELRSLEGTVV